MSAWFVCAMQHANLGRLGILQQLETCAMRHANLVPAKVKVTQWFFFLLHIYINPNFSLLSSFKWCSHAPFGCASNMQGGDWKVQ
ncbi:hypothetical protein GOP47_0021004 [Adiantum capillus-veneris]|uniref:Uncharacterized protein n=1 Tax=Adiantum capillus-veneris TaxID=13818 RepID=A0A9D4UBV0_ADICA|nr:hypothetical protein GOP47_0021004 [Adiantum capillus-veneris]